MPFLKKYSNHIILFLLILVVILLLIIATDVHVARINRDIRHSGIIQLSNHCL